MSAPLAARLAESARELGFVRIGFAEATRLDREASALDAWIARGDQASMEWMTRTAGVRADARHPSMLDGARSVVVVAAPYGADAPLDLAPGRIARYARGRDYHRVLDRRLRALVEVLQREGFRARPALDTKPVLERAYAERAGIGFVGKNACIIVPGVGSHVFLGCIITDAVLPASTPVREGCGECTRCLDACPTRAFRGPRTLDARRCIAYLTIEHEGAIDPELEPGLGDWLFGCDVCQDVCPYNAGRARAGAYDVAFATHPRFDGLSAEELATMDESRFDAFSAGSPLRRTGRDGLARNATVVLGNSGDRRHLPVLRELATNDVREVVRGTAARALARLESQSSGSSSESS